MRSCVNSKAVHVREKKGQRTIEKYNGTMVTKAWKGMMKEDRKRVIE
jgi:hypothetical protein